MINIYKETRQQQQNLILFQKEESGYKKKIHKLSNGVNSNHVVHCPISGTES